MKQVTDKRMHDSTKALWHMNRIIDHFDKNKRISSIHIDVGITKKCNMLCSFGYCKKQILDGSSIEKYALINNLVKSAAKIGVKSLGFIGDGEPTMNPECFNALSVGKNEGLSMAISTNGILVETEYKQRTILDSCEWMRFNISAYTEKGYRKVHNSNKRDIVFENVRNIVKLKRKYNSKCDIGIQMVFNPDEMLQEVIPLSQFAIDSGVDYFVIKQTSVPDEGQTGMTQFDLNKYDSKEVIDILKQAEALSNKDTDIIPKYIAMKLKGEKPYKRCLAISLISEISGNGNWFPCGYFFSGQREDLLFGNIHNNTLEEIINSDRYWNIINYLETEFKVGIECKGCCRMDSCNIFLDNYVNERPQSINFI